MRIDHRKRQGYRLACALCLGVAVATAGCEDGASFQVLGSWRTDVSPDEVVDAALRVLPQEGYDVLLSDRRSGSVTSRWRPDEADDPASGSTRVFVTFDRRAQSVSVQMARQRLDPDGRAVSVGLTEDDVARSGRIRRGIQNRVSIITGLGIDGVVIHIG